MPFFENGFLAHETEQRQIRTTDLMREYRIQAKKDAEKAIAEASDEMRVLLEKRYKEREHLLRQFDEGDFFRKYAINPEVWNSKIVPLFEKVFPVDLTKSAVSAEMAAIDFMQLFDEARMDPNTLIKDATSDEMGNALPLKEEKGALVDANGRFVARINRLPPRSISYVKGDRNLPGFDLPLLDLVNQLNHHHGIDFDRESVEKWPIAKALDVGLVGVCDSPNIRVAHRNLVRIEPVTPEEAAQGLVKLQVLNGDSAVVAQREIKEFRIAPQK